jgi:hypothetical protein
MSTYTFKATGTALASNSNATYAHGLGAVPDTVIVNQIVSGAGATNLSALMAYRDSANVTVYNGGTTISPNFEVIAIKFHSIIV